MNQNDDLIYRQAAIDALAEHEKSKGHNYTFFVDVVSECAEIIRDLPSAQQWIPVSEKPIPKGLVFVTYNDGDVDLLNQPTAYRRGDIVAWMPLPDPWKEDSNEHTN